MPGMGATRPRPAERALNWHFEEKESIVNNLQCIVTFQLEKLIGRDDDKAKKWRRDRETRLEFPRTFPDAHSAVLNAHICLYMRIISANATVFRTHICDRFKFFIFVETLEPKKPLPPPPYPSYIHYPSCPHIIPLNPSFTSNEIQACSLFNNIYRAAKNIPKKKEIPLYYILRKRRHPLYNVNKESCHITCNPTN